MRDAGDAERILVLSARPVERMLPALALLPRPLRTVEPGADALPLAPSAGLCVVDGAADPARARSLCPLLRAAAPHTPILLVVDEGVLPAVTAAWEADEIVLDTAGAAEVDARLRLLRRRGADGPAERGEVISVGHLRIDERAYTAGYRGRQLDLTFKEFELLRFLAARPGRVFTRERLLSEVWGIDSYGGTRTVDVHVRRLRAKLGEQETVIGTVRGVGYRLLGRETKE
ncbi:MAG: winged helix-turn-helix domain-containing protein [Pseudoclavibacter sp.]|nr:winged helix-turn-helix domain-containing protein [Pseudoclavibacter sp.]